jgi:drug/metabolite transporter (DMT)-like permease
VGRNPVSVVVPCHRVLGADGSLTGYAGGLERKRPAAARSLPLARRGAGPNRAGLGGGPMSAGWLAEFVLLAALWGASFLFMRLGAAEFGPLATAGLRVILATLFLWPIMLGRASGRPAPTLARHPADRVVNSALPFALYAWAVLSINTGLAAILNATTPLCGAAGLAVAGRAPGRLKALGLAIGFAGVVLLAIDRASFKPGGSGFAVLACLAATLCYGWAAN